MVDIFFTSLLIGFILDILTHSHFYGWTLLFEHFCYGCIGPLGRLNSDLKRFGRYILDIMNCKRIKLL